MLHAAADIKLNKVVTMYSSKLLDSCWSKVCKIHVIVNLLKHWKRTQSIQSWNKFFKSIVNDLVYDPSHWGRKPMGFFIIGIRYEWLMCTFCLIGSPVVKPKFFTIKNASQIYFVGYILTSLSLKFSSVFGYSTQVESIDNTSKLSSSSLRGRL